jgi:hypothetical protein
MSPYSLAHLSDRALLRDLAALAARDRSTTAELLAHIAEVDARKLYLPAAYPSMYAYCVGELKLSEEAAYKRIHAARAARRFPAIFAALADGRLNLTSVILLAPCLTPGNADDLLKAAAHRSKTGVAELIAERFPRPDVATLLEPVRPAPAPRPAEPGLGPGGQATLPPACQHAPERAGGAAPAPEHAPERVACESPTPEHAPERVGLESPMPEHAPERVGLESPVPEHAPERARLHQPRLTPLAPGRYALQVTISEITAERLRRAQQLLGHQIPPGDLAGVLDRALESLLRELEKRRFAAAIAPRADARRPRAGSRHVPAAVKRAVWARDGGRCTFVSETGRRCEARERLEFDHVEPFACGGRATLSGIRLRCRSHNQYAAERAFGSGFMQHKREEAKRAAGSAREQGRARAVAAGP